MASSSFGEETKEFVQRLWDASIESVLCEYIKIPNQSPLFDPEWNTNGLQERAVAFLTEWVLQQRVPGLTLEVVKEPTRTPLIFIEVQGQRNDDTVLLYGHLDKQPPMTNDWESGLGPWRPVIRDGKLYGRGGADDGYSLFAAVGAIAALKHQRIPHCRCVILIEACEESGSPDLPFYINKLSARIGVPSLVICLDSGCGNYEQLWLTTSLRGLVVGTLRVTTLREGVHSGASSGIVPDSFRIVRRLIGRIENEETGEMHRDLYVNVPEKHVQYAQEAASVVGSQMYSEFPWHQGTQPVTDDVADLCLNRSWRPTLVVTGVDGLPNLVSAGNVNRASTALKLSIRLPPTRDGQSAGLRVKEILEANPPYGADVSFTLEKASTGWVAPELKPWLEQSVNNASNLFYGRPVRFIGEGGSIPFMGMLGEKFPGVQFVITGVLGPKSNAHGPNEFLSISMTKNLICCVAGILADHCKMSTK